MLVYKVFWEKQLCCTSIKMENKKENYINENAQPVIKGV
jgi:hypothetical protein